MKGGREPRLDLRCCLQGRKERGVRIDGPCCRKRQTLRLGRKQKLGRKRRNNARIKAGSRKNQEILKPQKAKSPDAVSGPVRQMDGIRGNSSIFQSTT